MTCNEPKWLQVVPVPGSGGGGWGGVCGTLLAPSGH